MEKKINGRFRTKEQVYTSMTSIARSVATSAEEIKKGSGLQRADNPAPMLLQAESGSR